MKLIKSGFVIERMELKNNHLKPAKFKLKPKLTRKTGKINETTFFTELSLAIESNEEDRFPVDIHIDFKGIFEFADIVNQEDVQKFLEVKAVEIMYPYLRSMASNLTSAALMPPLVLPIMDPSLIFKQKLETTYIN